MTALCPSGGPSDVKPGVAGAVYMVGSALVDAVMTALELEEPWAAIISYAAGQTFDTASFCATDPPPMPTMDALTIATIIAYTAAGAPTEYQKLDDLIANGMWRVF